MGKEVDAAAAEEEEEEERSGRSAECAATCHETRERMIDHEAMQREKQESGCVCVCFGGYLC